MNKQKGFIWLASYPKSGNTWFRVFLANILSKENIPVSINSIKISPIFSGRNFFDENAGIDSSLLSHEEADMLRPDVFIWEAAQNQATPFHKVHDAYTLLPGGRPLIPSEVSQCALYFIRNPLDICVSFAHHLNRSIHETVERMNRENFCLANGQHKYNNQFRQKLLTWSQHVNSWTSDLPFPVKVIRYEDMIDNPLDTFSSALSFTGTQARREKIKQAIDFSRFERLKSEELENPFIEKPPDCKQFFRKGKYGSYRNEMQSADITEIIKNHSEVMKKYGYIDKNNNPIY